MAIVKMQKVAIIAHSALREEVISLLHTEGILEVRPAGEQQIDHTEVEYRKAEVEFAIDVLSSFADKQTLAICQRPAAFEDILHASKHTDVLGIVKTLHELEKQDTEAYRRMQELEDLCNQLTAWKTLQDTESVQESENVIRIIGTLPVAHEKILKESMTQDIPRSMLTQVSANSQEGAYTALIWKDDLHRFEEIATTLGWTTAHLPKISEAPAVVYENALMEQKALSVKLNTNEQKRRKLAIELPNLLKVRIFMHWADQKQEVRESMGMTDQTIILLGWMPAKKFELLESKLQKLSPATMLIKVKPDAGENVPVALNNAKWVTPFESVTTLYGLPLPQEMDPTAALSPFFALYFGLCLTDAGYGAVIALLTGILLLKTRKSIQEAKLIWLLMMSGIVTMIVSVPFGGWFGLTPEQVPAFLTYESSEGLKFYGQIWNLNEQSGISFLQNLALGLGLTHIFFGVFLAGLHKWTHGDKAGAFWQHFTAHILLGSVLLRAFAPESMTQVAMYGVYAAIALMVWGMGYGNPIFLRPVMGLLGVVNFAIGLLSNGLSYLRILALGLVTGAIALAVNQVALELGKLFPLWLGIPVIILIALCGHTVSIALNTLGSFIHSGRLQFIEFFSQFFEGGGKSFSPFSQKRHF